MRKYKITFLKAKGNDSLTDEPIYKDLFSVYAELKFTLAGESFNNSETKEEATIKSDVKVNDSKLFKNLKVDNLFVRVQDSIFEVCSDFLKDSGKISFQMEKIF